MGGVSTPIGTLAHRSWTTPHPWRALGQRAPDGAQVPPYTDLLPLPLVAASPVPEHEEKTDPCYTRSQPRTGSSSRPATSCSG